jgi:UDP-glucose 4-epimerase
MKKRVLVTGSSGFMGRSLVDKLLLMSDVFSDVVTMSRSPVINARPNTTHFTCDLGLCDSEDYYYECMHKICAQKKPDIIFHLAANPLTKLDESNPNKIIQDNIISTHKVIHSAPKGCRIILASSITVYGDWMFESDDGPEFYTEEMATKPTSLYAITKRTSESILESYCKMDRVSGASLRLCATVGPNLTHGVVKDFIRKLLSTNPYLEALGDYPGSTKPYLHINDAIDAFILLALSDTNGAFNVCPDDQITVEEVAHAVMDGCGVQKEIKWMGEGANWKGDNRFIKAGNLKLKQLGWNPQYPRSKDCIRSVVEKIHGN